MPSTTDLKPSPMALGSGLLLFLAGATIAAAGLQTVLMFQIWGPARFIPWAQILLGLATIAAGAPLSSSSYRAALAGLLLSVLDTTLTIGWIAWAAMHGLVSAMQMLGAALAMCAIPIVASTIPSTLRYHSARQALLHDAGHEDHPSTDQPGHGVIAVLLSAGLFSPLLLALAAPDIADRLFLQVSAVVHAVPPTESWLFVDERRDYSYGFNPFERYLEVEATHAPLDVQRARDWADDLAWEIALRMLAETGERDVHAAEAALWTDHKSGLIPAWIATALRDRGVVYHLESLLGRSFDPTMHAYGAQMHLDCDQLVYVYTHVAHRLDLDMRPIPGAMHAYLQYAPPDGVDGDTLYIETTHFADVDAAGEPVDRGAAVGLFLPEDYHRRGRGGTRASRTLAEAARLYQPADDDRLQDLIVSEVAAGLADHHPDVDVRAMLETERPGTADYQLVSNLYVWTLKAGHEALEAGDPATAAAEARRATALRQEQGALIVEIDRSEAVLLVEALTALGDAHGARAATVAALQDYRDNLGADPRQAGSRVHRQLIQLAEAQGIGLQDL